MINLLRSDFFKLFKSKALYICTLIAILLTAGTIFIVDWASHMVIKAQESGDVVVEGMTLYKDGLNCGLNVFSDGSVHLFMAIFIAIFVTAEFAHGTMKNIVSKGFKRYQVYLSKVITMTAATFLMLFVVSIFTTISGTVVTGTFGEVTGELIGQMLRMIGVELLLHTALTAVFVMVAMVVKNNGGVIAINIGITMFAALLYQLLELLFKNKIAFSDYSVMNNMINMRNLTLPGMDILRAILVAVAFFAVTVAIGIFAFNKTDVK